MRFFRIRGYPHIRIHYADFSMRFHADMRISICINCDRIWASFCSTGKRCKLCLKIIFLKLHCYQTVWSFQDFSTVLKSFCPLQSKNGLVLVPAHFFLLSNFHRFYSQTVIFDNFWGRYNAILELNVYSWTWTKVPIILEIVFRWFSFFLVPL